MTRSPHRQGFLALLFLLTGWAVPVEAQTGNGESPWSEDEVSPWAEGATGAKGSVIEISPTDIVIEDTSNAIVFRGDNHLVVNGVIYDLKTGEQVAKVDTEKLNKRGKNAIGPNGRFLLAAYLSEMTVYDLDEGTSNGGKLTDGRMNPNIDQVGFMGDSYGLVFWGSATSKMAIINLKSQREIKRLDMPNARRLAVAPDGRQAAFLYSKDGLIGDVRTGRQMRTLEMPKGDDVSYMFGGGEAFSPDSSELAALVRGAGLVIWDRTGKIVKQLDVPGSNSMHGSSLEWSADGKSILVGNTLVDRESGQKLMFIKSDTIATWMPTAFLGTDQILAARRRDNRGFEYVRITVPWETIREAAHAMQNDKDAILAPGKRIRVEFEIGQTYQMSRAQVQQALTKAVDDAFKPRRYIIDPAGTTTLLLKYSEKQGDLLPVYEGDHFDSRDTGRKVHEYSGTCELILTGPDGKKRWGTMYRSSGGRTFDGPVTEGTVRGRMHEAIVGSVSRMKLPNYMSADGTGVSLPIEVNLLH